MLFNKELSETELNELFNNNLKCLEFLAELKWSNGFECKKCGHDNYCPGKTPFSRRCTKCKTEESATAGTIFHHCRFDLSKAFFMAYSVCKGIQDFSSYEFSRRLTLRQMTCWKFMDKLKKNLNSGANRPSCWEELLTGKESEKSEATEPLVQ